ncbi:molybdopterin-dependent oxidoreductase [Phyllobacterium endophyticum]|uniref:molybdopterin-dependent oxidoreductase n=1 Tax=Phyllobacterium endophyticum TaxID=1149773 RepID=UPI0011C80FBE|nr:molybdopterin-dependent oxidoreductase [Phyllobacterium endophyticum]TXR49543.1 oxidoreductase [Phyllobacterium endophyticum]
MNIIRLFTYIALSIATITNASAGSLAKPEGKAILSISGKIENTNSGTAAEFDRAMLENIGLETIETTTPWYDSRVRFEGVPLDKLMQLVGATGTKMTAIALNDYVTTIPMEDFKKFKVVLALKRDGNYMPVRDKGPLFIVYPYESDPQLQSQTYYTRSAWQVAKLIIE